MSKQTCEAQNIICQWVYTKTDNSTLASVVSWLTERPLQILLIFVIAAVLTRLARVWIGRVVRKMMTPEVTHSDRLGRIGIDLPKVLDAAVDPRREARARSASVVLTSTVVVVIWAIAIITAFGIAGINVQPMLTGAGIAGVALGFGAQNLVKDCIAGLFMLIEDQYGIGDVIDLGEAVGVVEEITLRTTVLRSLDGTVWHVPNGVVQRVGNHSQLWSIALLDVEVGYTTDLATAREVLESAAQEVAQRPEMDGRVLEPPTVLGVEQLGASGVTLRLSVKVAPGAQFAYRRQALEHIKQRFDEAGIEIPFPQRVVWSRPVE